MKSKAEMRFTGIPHLPPWLLFTLVIGFFLFAAAFALVDQFIDGDDR